MSQALEDARSYAAASVCVSVLAGRLGWWPQVTYHSAKREPYRHDYAPIAMVRRCSRALVPVLRIPSSSSRSKDRVRAPPNGAVATVQRPRHHRLRQVTIRLWSRAPQRDRSAVRSTVRGQPAAIGTAIPARADAGGRHLLPLRDLTRPLPCVRVRVSRMSKKYRLRKIIFTAKRRRVALVLDHADVGCSSCIVSKESADGRGSGVRESQLATRPEAALRDSQVRFVGFA